MFDGLDLAQSRRNLGAIWGRGAISARSRRDLRARPLHQDYLGTGFASNAVHMHQDSSPFVKMAPNGDTRGVGVRGHQEGTLKTPRPKSNCSSPLTSLSSHANRYSGVVVVVVRGIIGVGDRVVRSSDSVGGGE